ncbi:hypothetical protein C8R46DRAFT_1207074 [Mycena filopes]|nr:hypothetical protein C8R46DRAFT_1207074 [Mycena filopes]
MVYPPFPFFAGPLTRPRRRRLDHKPQTARAPMFDSHLTRHRNDHPGCRLRWIIIRGDYPTN